MKVWVFVEGESDRLALEALWRNWKHRLGEQGWGLSVIALKDKSRFFRKIGPRAAEKLRANSDDVVVGLPDLYPNHPYHGTPYRHAGHAELTSVQVREVKNGLRRIYNVRAQQLPSCLERFHASALKHDLEMLLLAAKDELRKTLGTSETLGDWREPVEEQDQGMPPKRVVEDLFRRKSQRKRVYRDTKDAPAVLRQVSDLRRCLFTDAGRETCPVFKMMLDWLGTKTGVTPYKVDKTV